MIKSFVWSLALTVGALILQSTWLSAIAVRSVTPDLALLIVVYVSFHGRSLQGQALGFVTGFLQDGISAGPMGLNSFVKAAVAWTFSSLSGKFYIDRLLMPMLFGFAATVYKALIYGGLSLILPGKVLGYDFAAAPLWIEAGYTAAAAPVLFLILIPLNRLLIPRSPAA